MALDSIFRLALIAVVGMVVTEIASHAMANHEKQTGSLMIVPFKICKTQRKQTKTQKSVSFENLAITFPGLLDTENLEAVQKADPIPRAGEDDIIFEDIGIDRMNGNVRVRREAKDNNTNSGNKTETAATKKSSASDLMVYIPIYMVSMAVLLQD